MFFGSIPKVPTLTRVTLSSNMVPSSNGQETALSMQEYEFDSRWNRQLNNSPTMCRMSNRGRPTCGDPSLWRNEMTQITGTLRNAYWNPENDYDPRHPNLVGIMDNDIRGRFYDGEKVWTSTVFKHLGDDVYKTRYSTYKVEWRTPEDRELNRPEGID